MKNVKNIDKWLKEYLIEHKITTSIAIEKLESDAKKNHLPFHEVVIQQGFLNSNQVLDLISEVSYYEVVNLEETNIEADLIASIPKDLIAKFNIIPLSQDKFQNRLTICTSEPNNLLALDTIRQSTKSQLVVKFSLYGQIQGIIANLEKNFNMQTIIEEMRGGSVTIEETDEAELSAEVESTNSDEPVIVRMVSSVLGEAVSVGASDIHIEPHENSLRIRYRIDGILVEKHKFEKQFINQITSRIKVMSNLDISETRRPQDGRFKFKYQNMTVDVRVSTLNTQFGEKIVMRLTNKDVTLTNIENMGFTQEEVEKIKKISGRPYGLILVTGPTGSGKTTTLYGMLNSLNSPSKNIVTIEDPIERQLPGIIHTPVNPKADITFHSGLKTILRQDPDIIMVGEIRDFETAETTISAALTGHLVLSTLHTNDAAGSVTRLSDMNVESFKVASSVIAVIAQRLVRVTCPHCKEEHNATMDEINQLRSIDKAFEIPDQLKLHKGKGCKHCSMTGYKGRQGVFEILTLSEEIKKMIINGESSSEIQKQAKKEGMKTMTIRGLELVLSGVTTLDEIKRVIFIE